MNVETLNAAWDAGELSEGDTVTVTGEVRQVYEGKSGESQHGPWSLLPILFGDAEHAVRITVWNPPSGWTPGRGDSLKLKATVAPYGEKLQLKVSNILEQLNTAESAPDIGDEDITPSRPAPAAPKSAPVLYDWLTALVDMQVDAYTRAARRIEEDGGGMPSLEALWADAGTNARTIWVSLDRNNKLAREVDDYLAGQTPF